jgi:ribosomal protein S18 acetylase RimI-like enzyme
MERDAAEAEAVRDFATVLLEGLQTKGHWLYVIEADGQSVGCLWFAERDLDGRPTAFLYDVHIDEDARGHGYGRAAMRTLETTVKPMGVSRIDLNVFGDNTTAISLYQSLGYQTLAMGMRKPI